MEAKQPLIAALLLLAICSPAYAASEGSNSIEKNISQIQGLVSSQTDAAIQAQQDKTTAEATSQTQKGEATAEKATNQGENPTTAKGSAFQPQPTSPAATVSQSSSKVVKWLFENADSQAETGQAEQRVSPMTAGLVYRNVQAPSSSRSNAPLWPLLLFGGMMGGFGVAAYAFRKKGEKSGA